MILCPVCGFGPTSDLEVEAGDVWQCKCMRFACGCSESIAWIFRVHGPTSDLGGEAVIRLDQSGLSVSYIDGDSDEDIEWYAVDEADRTRLVSEVVELARASRVLTS